MITKSRKFEKLDKSEKNRVSEISKKLAKEKKFEPSELFRYSIMSAINKEVLAIHGGFNQERLITAVPFYSKVLVEICKECECARNPALLQPFLESGFAIPILLGRYSDYKEKFVNTILPYPHFSRYEFAVYRNTVLNQIMEKYWISKGLGEAPSLCPHCAKEYENEFITLTKKFPPSIQTFLLKYPKSHFFSSLYPFYPPEHSLIKMMINALEEKNIKKVMGIDLTASHVNLFRTAQAFSATPQLSVIEDSFAERITQVLPELKKLYEVPDLREMIVNQLMISYTPSIKLETYLDIILPKQHKIQKIVNEYISRGDPQNPTFYAKTQKELDKINQEIREIEASKKTKVINLPTSFIAQNPGVMTGIIIGTCIGAPMGLVGCGAGGLVGGATFKFLGEGLRIPREAKELAKIFISIFEPAYEKFLAFSLSKDIKAIQVWRLRKELRIAKRK